MTWNDVLTLNFDVYKCLLMLKKSFQIKKKDFGFEKVGLSRRGRENVSWNWVIWEDGVRGSEAE